MVRKWKLLRRVCRLAGLLFMLGVAPVFAQSYPGRPIRLVVPYPAGGVNDIIARILAQKVSESLGQQMIVDNRPGAGGNIGTDLVAKAPADGYTLLSGGVGSLVMNPIIAKVPYDTLRDFAPVTLIATSPNVLVVHPSLPVRNVSDLIVLAKARPGELNYGSGGVGSTPHLSGALFTSMAGINIVHVPYKGTAPAMTDLLAGQVQLAFLGIPPAIPHVRGGKLRAVAVTGTRQSLALPGVPTVAESGLAGYEVSPWFGVLAPVGTPPAVVARLNSEISKAMLSAELRGKLAAQGVEPAVGSPEEYVARIKADIAKWARVIRGAGIRGD